LKETTLLSLCRGKSFSRFFVHPQIPNKKNLMANNSDEDDISLSINEQAQISFEPEFQSSSELEKALAPPRPPDIDVPLADTPIEFEDEPPSPNSSHAESQHETDEFEDAFGPSEPIKRLKPSKQELARNHIERQHNHEMSTRRATPLKSPLVAIQRTFEPASPLDETILGLVDVPPPVEQHREEMDEWNAVSELHLKQLEEMEVGAEEEFAPLSWKESIDQSLELFVAELEKNQVSFFFFFCCFVFPVPKSDIVEYDFRRLNCFWRAWFKTVWPAKIGSCCVLCFLWQTSSNQRNSIKNESLFFHSQRFLSAIQSSKMTFSPRFIITSLATPLLRLVSVRIGNSLGFKARTLQQICVEQGFGVCCRQCGCFHCRKPALLCLDRSVCPETSTRISLG
jgi:hypothetical protein